MADIKSKYGSNGQALTCTVASLANASMRESTAIDNTTNLFLNALVTAKIKLNSAGVSATGYINIHAYATTDGGTTYSAGATGSDAAFSGEKTNLVLVASLTANANSMTATAVFDIASAFGGVMPDHWGLVVENQSGAALDSTGSNHFLKYQGTLGQTV